MRSRPPSNAPYFSAIRFIIEVLFSLFSVLSFTVIVMGPLAPVSFYDGESAFLGLPPYILEGLNCSRTFSLIVLLVVSFY